MDPGEVVSSVNGADGAIVTLLVSAVVALWRGMSKRSREVEERLTEKLDQCEQRHEAAHVEMGEMKQTIGRLEGKVEGMDQSREDFKAFSQTMVRLLEDREGKHSGKTGGKTEEIRVTSPRGRLRGLRASRDEVLVIGVPNGVFWFFPVLVSLVVSR